MNIEQLCQKINDLEASSIQELHQNPSTDQRVKPLTVRTLRHYLQQGLLTKPQKLGKELHFTDVQLQEVLSLRGVLRQKFSSAQVYQHSRSANNSQSRVDNHSVLDALLHAQKTTQDDSDGLATQYVRPFLLPQSVTPNEPFYPSSVGAQSSIGANAATSCTDVKVGQFQTPSTQPQPRTGSILRGAAPTVAMTPSRSCLIELPDPKTLTIQQRLLALERARNIFETFYQQHAVDFFSKP